MTQTTAQRQSKYRRFDRGQRIEHFVLLVSFTVLAVSGLPQKWPDSRWGGVMISAMGGIELTRIIHHASAAVLIVLTLYHFLAVGYRIWVKRTYLTMLPTFQDMKDGIQALGYNVGIAQEPPSMGRYTFGEKVEYWAVIWGTVVMILTGLLLWNPIAATRFLPGQAIPAAKAAHGGEALLAVLAIVTWHLYHVHIKHFNRSMFTGDISRHEVETEHALELEAIESGTATRVVDPNAMHRRKLAYLPVATVLGLAFLLGTIYFLTFEQTAITSVPREDVPVFAPVTPSPDIP